MAASPEVNTVAGAGAAAAPASMAGQVWMPVKHAARAAGVPERSAFRWAKKGVIPVRRSGKVQLVEVAALRAWAARPVNARQAGAAATAGAVLLAGGAASSTQVPGLVAPFPAGVAPASAVPDLHDRLCALEDFAEDVSARLAALEARVEKGG